MIIRDANAARLRASEIIKAGGVIAFRTDTFYGLGAAPFNRQALARIRTLKVREGDKPILILISDEEQASHFIARRTPLFDAIAGAHWPGALTLVAAAKEEVPLEITAGTGTVGVRLPDDVDVREFVRACGGVLTATSANLAGEPPARTAFEVERYFPTELDLIIDGGAARTEKASTVLDVSTGASRLIREGEVSRQDLEQSGVNFD
jgi:L-threonylcarbamoyladenylate synthase